MIRAGATVTLALVLLCSCARDVAPPATPAADTSRPWLEEVAAVAGVDFVAESGHDGRQHLFPESVFGGCALLDMDGDADLDLYLVQAGGLGGDPATRPRNRLYRNDGGMTFTDVTEDSGADDPGYGCGAATGDYDGDGDPDLYVTNVGRNTLLRNEGAGRFTDVTDRAGVGDQRWGTSTAFLDFDSDGDLDLFVVNYVGWSRAGELDCYNDLGTGDYCLPTNYNSPVRDALYRNEGNGRFTDVSIEAGMGEAFGNGLGVVCADWNEDGRIDVFVANDTMMNQLWINQGDGRFAEEALLRGCAYDEHGKAKAGMGTDTIDLDDDGDLDLVVANLAGETNSLYRNDGEYFGDLAGAFGIAGSTRPFTGFGIGFIDFDQDGRVDLYQANGRVQQAAEFPGNDPYAEPNLLLRGTATGVFEEVQPRGGTDTPLIGTSRGAAFGDLDGDGAMDIVVVNRDGPVHVLRNVVSGRGHAVRFHVRERSGAHALGATVTLRAGERAVRRDVRTAYGYCVANDPAVHVGLGDVERVTDVRVRWIDGTTEDFGAFAAGLHELRRGAGREMSAGS